MRPGFFVGAHDYPAGAGLSPRALRPAARCAVTRASGRERGGPGTWGRTLRPHDKTSRFVYTPD
jgi:hypothetical protein